MQQNIFTIGFDTHTNDITNLTLNSDEALYDFDVIIVRPNFGSLASKATTLGSGGRVLLAPRSENLVDRVIHWREQLDQALAGGKTVFVLCEKPEDLGVSHTPSKYRSISEVQPDQTINSYDMLPDRP